MIRRIKKRYHAAVQTVLPTVGLRVGVALGEALREGYGAKELQADVMAGLVVGIVALPLSMALAIATGVPPQHGLYTAIIAGGVTALLGGSRCQVSGPTAAFVVVLAPITAKFGIGGLLVASGMAGMFLLVLGLARMGKLIQYIPYPVTTGFTAGIAVVIATLQMRDFLGLTVDKLPEHYLERVAALVGALPTTRWSDLAIGATTLALLLLWPRLTKRLPAPLVALAAAGVLGALGTRLIPGFQIATIGSRFSYLQDGISHPGIPQLPPLPLLPWELAGPEGAPVGLSLPMLRELLPSAFAIAMLGAIESLLSAVVSDGMTGTKHDPDAELVAQGVGNVLAPFFGGFAATGAIARTATNIRSGAKSPIAAVVHALFVLAAVMLLAPLVAYLPMASLAALLLLVAWNMSEVRHFAHVVKVAPKSDVIVQLACFSLTVLFDMVVSVTAGVMLAALLFMRRMAEISDAKLLHEGTHPELREPLPKGVALYEIAGPLFFGAAQKAMSSLNATAGQARAIILDVSAVPAMDATGLVNLESAIERLHKAHSLVVLAGVQRQPAKVLERAGLVDTPGRLVLCKTVQAAVAIASEHVGAEPPPSSRRTDSHREGPRSERGPASRPKR